MVEKKGRAKKTPAKKRSAGGGGLSAVQRKKMFVEAYLSNNRNALKAAISAGFSEKTAGSQGSRMLKNVEVQQMINSRCAEVCANLEITTERILLERSRLAFFDARKLFDQNGKPIPIHKLDDDTAAAVAGLDVEEATEHRGVVRKYKVSDKNASLTALEKHLGLYEKDNRQKNPLEDLPRDTLKEIQARIAGLVSRG